MPDARVPQSSKIDDTTIRRFEITKQQIQSSKIDNTTFRRFEITKQQMEQLVNEIISGRAFDRPRFLQLDIAVPEWDGDVTHASNICTWGRATLDGLFGTHDVSDGLMQSLGDVEWRASMSCKVPEILLTGVLPPCTRWEQDLPLFFESDSETCANSSTPWLKVTQHPFDLMFMFYAQCGHRCSEEWPSRLYHRFLRAVHKDHQVAFSKWFLACHLLVEHAHLQREFIPLEFVYTPWSVIHSVNAVECTIRRATRNKAATRIQAVFRGWRTRVTYRFSPDNPLGRFVIHKMFAAVDVVGW
jgi:hypothetical protein